MAGTVAARVAFAAKGGRGAGSVCSSKPSRYSQAARVASSQAHLERPAATRRAPPQASGAARGRKQASARAAEQRTRATSRSTAKVPTTTSTRKLLPSLRRAAVTEGWRWVPSQTLAWLAPVPRRRLSITVGPRAGAPPEGPLLALARAASAQARARASTRSLLVRRPASASRRSGAARARKVLSSEVEHLYWTLAAHSP